MLALLLAAMSWLLPGGSFATVFGDDDRRPWYRVAGALHPARARSEALPRALGAAGGITCRDGGWFSGFIIDVSAYRPDFSRPVLVTTAHTFVTGDGAARSPCRFIPKGGHGPGHELEYIQTGLGPRERRKPADARDWAFALVPGLVEGSFARLQGDFGARSDFERDAQDPRAWAAVSFVRSLGDVVVASRCRPDDKRSYREFAVTDPAQADFAAMIIHDCDFAEGASGGPLLRRTAAGWRVVGIHVGDAGREWRGSSGSAWYAPPRSFNFSRRLDPELESALVRYLRLVPRDAP